MDILTHGATAVVCFGAGCWFYRYWLKRDPERLEAFAQKVKQKARERGWR